VHNKTGRLTPGGRAGLLSRGGPTLKSDFGRTLEALAAKDFLYLPTVFHDLDLVKVGLKRAWGRLHGKASVSPEGRRLSTLLTLGHRPRILSSISHQITSGAYLTTSHPFRSFRSDTGARPA
jgi:hypothetical protein